MAPTTQRMRDRPTEPERARMVDGVAKIPVPIMRLKMRKTALVRPIWRRDWFGMEMEMAWPSSLIWATTSFLTFGAILVVDVDSEGTSVVFPLIMPFQKDDIVEAPVLDRVNQSINSLPMTLHYLESRKKPVM